MKLWEIDDQIRSCVDYETGEIIDPEYLENLMMAREQKIENVALYIKELTYFTGVMESEIANLTKRKKAAENAVKGMKEWLVGACYQTKFETPRCKVTFRTSQETIIDNEVKIPDRYKSEKIVITVDKTAVKKAILAGEKVTGAHIKENVNATVK